MDPILHLAAQKLLEFDRVAFHVYAWAAQGSEALAAFAPRSSQAWLARHESVQPWTGRSAALVDLWRRALTRPEALSAAVSASGLGARWAEHQAGRLGNPSIHEGALVWHVAVLGLEPDAPFNAIKAARGLAELLTPLMGAYSLVELPAQGRILQRENPGMPTSLPSARDVRKLPDFAAALHSAFEAVILSEGPRAPQGPAASRL